MARSIRSHNIKNWGVALAVGNLIGVVYKHGAADHVLDVVRKRGESDADALQRFLSGAWAVCVAWERGAYNDLDHGNPKHAELYESANEFVHQMHVMLGADYDKFVTVPEGVDVSAKEAGAVRPARVVKRPKPPAILVAEPPQPEPKAKAKPKAKTKAK